jgi:hypothetical protein
MLLNGLFNELYFYLADYGLGLMVAVYVIFEMLYFLQPSANVEEAGSDKAN